MKSENLAQSLAQCSELGARIQRAGTMSLHGVALALLLVPAVAAAGFGARGDPLGRRAPRRWRGAICGSALLSKAGKANAYAGAI